MRSALRSVAIAVAGVATLMALSPLALAQDRHVPGELLVRFAPDTSEAEIETINRDTGCEVIRLIEFIDVYQLRIITESTVDEVVGAYATNEKVEFAEPNYTIEIADRIPNNAERWPNDPTFTPGDPAFGGQWSLDNWGQLGGTVDADIDAPQMWRMITEAADSIIVAVLDTGVDWNHPDLALNIWTNPVDTLGGGDDDENNYPDDIHGWDFIENDNDPYDLHNHGTHVAGIIGAVGNDGVGMTGVCWRVQLVPVRILGADGMGNTADLCLGIDYAMHAKAKIINLSLQNYEYSHSLYYSVERADWQGILVVCAAGNLNMDVDVAGQECYPGSLTNPNVITVAASDQRDLAATFTNYGAISVDLAAPGVDIISTFPGGGYGLMSGTSQAAPHVSGAAALCWTLEPWLNHYQLRELFLIDSHSFNDAWKEKKPAFRLDGAKPVVTEGRLRAAQNADFGDAPDGPYPTFWPPVPWGAIHLDCGLEWIGWDVSVERSADDWDLTDTDGEANLNPLNTDHFDDGVVFFPPYFCKGQEPMDRVDVVITVSDPHSARYGGEKFLYLNSFFDFDNDGDWFDIYTCVVPNDAPEHLLIQAVGGPGAPSVVNPLPDNKLIIDPTIWPAGAPQSMLFELYFYSPEEYVVGPDIWTRFRVEYDDKVWPTPDNKYLGTEFTYSLFGEVEDHLTETYSPVDSLPDMPGEPMSPPESFRLGQNSPNPFNPFTMIAYDLPIDCHVRLDIYDARGRNVTTLVDGHQTAGRKSVLWNSRDSEGYGVTSGTYFYRIQAGDYTQIRKMVLLK